jgi:hypothetical protein
MVLELMEDEAEPRAAPAEKAEATGWDPLSGARSAADLRRGAKASVKRRGKGTAATPRQRRKARKADG